MKNAFLIIGFFLYLTGYSQNIGEFYKKSKDAVVLIKTSESEVIQTDAAINEESSGATMFNLKGEVVVIIYS